MTQTIATSPEPKLPPSGGSYNGGRNRPPVASGQNENHEYSPEDLAHLTVALTRALIAHRQARKEAQ